MLEPLGDTEFLTDLPAAVEGDRVVAVRLENLGDRDHRIRQGTPVGEGCAVMLRQERGEHRGV